MNTPAPWRILVVDDEEGVHGITRMIFRGYRFEDRPVELISALSGAEARALLSEQPDICLALLDVVMESDDEGLRLVDHIRNELGNLDMRIILRTGHPGLAPETDVILKYDLNDYLSKSELSASRLLTSVVVALRSYRDICLARHQYPLDSLRPRETPDLIKPLIRPLLQQHQHHLDRLRQLDHSPMAKDLLLELLCNQLRMQNLFDQAEPTSQLRLAVQPVAPRKLIETLIGDLLPLARQQHRLLDYRYQTSVPERLNFPAAAFRKLWFALLDHCLTANTGPDLRLNLSYAPDKQQLELKIEGEQPASPQQVSCTASTYQNFWNATGRPYCDALAQQLGGSITILVDEPNKVVIICTLDAAIIEG
tara:strand:+ start:7606 stop:8703 length:1098 start_codon:yes stop_codon:yes gene_type:complete